MFFWIAVMLLAVLLLWGGPGAAQTFFTDVTKEIGIPLFNARSVAPGDYDNDGRPDIFVSETWNVSSSRVALLHNEGGGRFADRTATIRADFPPQEKGGGAIFGDYDNDGDLDLYVPIGTWVSSERARNLLLRNDRGVFREVGIEAGLTDVLPSDNAIWLDYNRDSWLDLYVGNLGAGDPTLRNTLYRNDGDGTFTNVTEEAGLNVEIQKNFVGSNGGMAGGDFNNDGWPDLYIGAWASPNRLFLNDGQGKFRDATTSEIADPGQAHGVAVGGQWNRAPV